MSVNHTVSSGGIIRIMVSIFFNMKAFCVFLLESPHRGDFDEYTQYTIINIKRKSPKPAAIGFSQGLKNEFETIVVIEPTVFEPLMSYCI